MTEQNLEDLTELVEAMDKAVEDLASIHRAIRAELEEAKRDADSAKSDAARLRLMLESAVDDRDRLDGERLDAVLKLDGVVTSIRRFLGNGGDSQASDAIWEFLNQGVPLPDHAHNEPES